MGRALLLAVLLTGLTTFMFLPLLAVQLTAQGLKADRVGILVGLLAFCGQGFSLVSGLIVDRFGTKAVLTSGFALRIAGYLLLGLGFTGESPLAPLVAGIVAIGIGGSLLGLSIKTLLVRQDSVSPREMLALRSTFVNLGVVVGPALGAVVYPIGFRYILGACVASHLSLGLWLALRLPRQVQVQVQVQVPVAMPAPVAGGPKPAPAGDDDEAPGAPEPGPTPWARWQWVPLFGIGVAFWAIYSQLNVVLPIAATELTGSAAAISVVFTLNGALVVLFQYTLLRHVFRSAATRSLLVIGFLAFAFGYALLVAFGGWTALLAFVLPITLAEMLIAPSLDEQAIEAASPQRTGLALGTMSAAGALGSLLGSGMGGYLMQSFRGDGTLWVVISCLSAVAAASCYLLPKGRTQHA
ncbi:MFS transporter [Streptomyces sp. NBC_01298]|uniref:MFS transporter n=1 Tax=Streptomyces sp. NBC_01298 TaxID=2903817 RepID=UPI002E11C0BA|nr:MFS transporter [Streptomyces sp. NBC_01298]